MAYEFYRAVHFLGIALLFVCVGGLFQMVYIDESKKAQVKKFWVICHGVSMFFVLLGGFGMLAKIGMVGSFPLWVWIKLGVWMMFGASMSVFLRKPQFKGVTLIALFLLAMTAFITIQIKPS